MHSKNVINRDRNLTREVAADLGAPERQREAYRQACTMRRRGNQIERLEQGRWVLDWQSKSINAAKRESRKISEALYAV